MVTSRRRLLIVAHSVHRGGAEYCLDTMLSHLDRERFEAIVVFPDEGPMTESARRMGYEVRVSPICHWLYFHRDGWYWRNLARRLIPNVMSLSRWIRKREIDLVYTNTSAIFESAIAARLAGVPHVWHVHEILKCGNAMEQTLPLGLMKRLIYRWSDRVVFESNRAREVFEESAPGDRSEVVYNSLRLRHDRARSPNRAARHRFGLLPGDEVVGFVGQLIDRKNPLLLIRALERIRDRSNLKALFVGDGPLREPLAAEIARLGLSDRVRLVPFQDDVQDVLDAIDVLVLPSRQESFGLVLLEAGARCKPVIACDSEGPSEIVVAGKTGLLVPQDDPESLANAIESMFNGELDRRALGEAGRNRVEAFFDPSKNTRLLESIFTDVVENRGLQTQSTRLAGETTATRKTTTSLRNGRLRSVFRSGGN
jgi:glycosyltransferase involved in cell wall biosynthesis